MNDAKPASGDGLPELPAPLIGYTVTGSVPRYYTADQMRAYGEQCRRLATPEQPEIAGVRDTLIVAANNPVSHGGLNGLQQIMRAQAERLRNIEQPGSSVQGEAKPLVWIEQSVYDDLITEKPWVFGANNTFCQRRTDEYTIPLYTTPPPAPAAEQLKCPECGAPGLMIACIACSAHNYPPAPAAEQGDDNNLPGMWSHTDFTGGDPDERSHAERSQPEARGVEGMVLVPKELAERVMDALVRFTGDEGWTMPDMDVADALGAILTTPNPVRAKQPEEGSDG